MSPIESVFALPDTPAAKCLHLMRLTPLTTRAELVEATGLSQPTVTRAVNALIEAGLVIQRTDLTRSHGRGRPTVPVELTDSPWMHGGIAVGTQSTYIGLFDVRGRTIRDTTIDLPIATMAHDDVIEHLMAGLNRLTVGIPRPLTTVGLTFPGFIEPHGSVDAPSLGWRRIDIIGRLHYQFSVPVTISAAVPAILGSELQASELHFASPPPTALALFADDSIGAARTDGDGVRQLDVELADDTLLTTAGLLKGTGATSLPELVARDDDSSRARLDTRARDLGVLAAELISEHRPDTLVVAGGAFIDDPQAPGKFARSVREQLGADLQGASLRLIPTHDEVVRAIARAIALDRVLRDPLSLAG
ncbi:Crp/Fnr family transcriptional regulator [Corynebacterium yudongzhengii]|uniref:ROK family transcriptional regulator n=1 Tax=Corynebacterium yudongzhengii TaxID=2080740 RepID=A0A2U1T449_9CORY|nr:ROK family transcriptional regulator [Corynebacterium yudongzhengii]AWB81001.1 Crp/Fnr family transcriptional regulator [Corynebacterium yudongzhengii]PWC00777.1 ROK family transcriptional regulator [Corynebacterium yudongzhengii]